MNRDAPDIKKAHICFVGNMLGRNPGYVTTQGQVVADLLAADGFSVTCVSSKISRSLRLAEIMRTLVTGRRKFDAVVVEVYSGAGFVIADAAARLCGLFGLPVVMVLHGGHLPEFMARFPRWTKSVLNRANSLVSPSGYMAEKIGNFGFRIEQIANTIDLDHYAFRERSAIEPRLIWMRSFHPIYNPAMAINVFARLLATVPNATLTMAGVDKGMECEIRQMAERLGVAKAVRFPGFLHPKEKAREFAAADIYLNTNRIDNMPVSVVVACAFGLPVVATNVGGVPYLIEHGENGVLVRDDDAAEMADAVKRLLGDPDLTRRISIGARRLAEDSGWKHVRGKWEKLLARVMTPALSNSDNPAADGLSAEKVKA